MKTLFLIIIINFLFLTFSFSKVVTLGMTGDFSGSVKYLGNNMRIGINTYFNEINNNSELKFKLESLDDNYNPIRASENVKKLILNNKILAFIGNIGTPTANAVLPILNREEVVLFGAYSGGEVLRTNSSFAFNYRTSYYNEAYHITKGLIKKGLKIEDIAILSQNDTYGDSGYYGAVKAFTESFPHKLHKITHVRYLSGSTNIENALSHLLDLDVEPKAVIMVSTALSTAKFINYAKSDFPNLKFFSLSPIDMNYVKNKIGKHIKDLYITQVVPSLDSSLPIVKDYLASISKFHPNYKPTLISLEGYIVAKLFVQALKKSNIKEFTRKNIFEILSNVDDLDIDLGFVSDFRNQTREYSSSLWLTTYRNKLENSIEWDDISFDNKE